MRGLLGWSCLVSCLRRAIITRSSNSHCLFIHLSALRGSCFFIQRQSGLLLVLVPFGSLLFPVYRFVRQNNLDCHPSERNSPTNILSHIAKVRAVMAIKHRAAQVEGNQINPMNPMTEIHSQDTNLRPDILNTAKLAAPSNIESPLPSQTFAPFTASSASGLLTDTAPLTTSTHSPTPTFTSTPTSIVVITSSATPTQTSPPSSGISPGRLTAAIVVPIAILAILIPVLTYWFLSHRRKRQEQKYASQRGSNSREPMIQNQMSYRGPPPDRPLRTPNQKHSPQNSIAEPPAAQTRNSLGMFNFELSPTTPGPLPGSRESEASPRFRFSIARALEMRRSQPSIVQPHARTSDARVSRNGSSRPETRGSNRNSRPGPFNPPPPYISPRPSETAAARSHFAPLSRIGTRSQTERSPPGTADTKYGAAEADSPTYASSDTIQDPGSYGHVLTRSTSPSLEWPSPPQAQGVLARKPIPSHSPRIASQAISPQIASHLDGPFSSYLPERLSDVSGFSIDTSRWEDHSRQESLISEIHSDESSTIYPHNLV